MNLLIHYLCQIRRLIGNNLSYCDIFGSAKTDVKYYTIWVSHLTRNTFKLIINAYPFGTDYNELIRLQDQLRMKDGRKADKSLYMWLCCWPIVLSSLRNDDNHHNNGQ
jgi:hypothetical protein